MATAQPTVPALIHDAIARALAGPYVYRTRMPVQGGPELAESAESRVRAALIHEGRKRRGVAPETVAALNRCWRRGDSTRVAAAVCGVSQPTAVRYYGRFRSAALVVAGG